MSVGTIQTVETLKPPAVGVTMMTMLDCHTDRTKATTVAFIVIIPQGILFYLRGRRLQQKLARNSIKLQETILRLKLILANFFERQVPEKQVRRSSFEYQKNHTTLRSVPEVMSRNDFL
jgi:hypothetical protein